jgi:hypothetical protein
MQNPEPILWKRTLWRMMLVHPLLRSLFPFLLVVVISELILIEICMICVLTLLLLLLLDGEPPPDDASSSLSTSLFLASLLLDFKFLRAESVAISILVSLDTNNYSEIGI